MPDRTTPHSRGLEGILNAMRLSSLSDYAVVMMSAAARHREDGRLSATMLSQETGVPLPTAQKVMGKMAAAGLLHSARGAGGGFTLARDPSEITLAEIVEALEGPIGADAPAPVEAAKPHWSIVGAALKGALAGISLAVLAGEMIS